MDKDLASKLIRLFALNQSNITKSANTRRGITNKLIKEERVLVKNIFEGLTGATLSDVEIEELIRTFS
jgi:hypothetical protein